MCCGHHVEPSSFLLAAIGNAPPYLVTVGAGQLGVPTVGSYAQWVVLSVLVVVGLRCWLASRRV